MNIINAIINLTNNPVIQLKDYYQGRNRANSTGGALEEYIKDLFANTLCVDEQQRLETLNTVYSYLGNQNNPPDAMLRGGDAIEVKKIETDNAALALNSSYPKHILLASSTMITSACKNSEKWAKKDIIYTVGVVKNNCLRHLSMVYGLDYCASDECYTNIRNRIIGGIKTVQGIPFEPTNELGHINYVDPLGITYMRIRGMWGIANPCKAFDYVYSRDKNKNFTFMCIINKTKWNSFDNTKELLNLVQTKSALNVEDIRIKNPDNPAQMKDAKLITFSV